jgi:hypothetical protein
LPLPSELDEWSDLALTQNVSGSYNAGTKVLTITVSPQIAGDLEIGSTYGPTAGSGRHYGTGGTLGGPFFVTMSVTGVQVQSDGTVNAGQGGSVTVTFTGGAAGSVGTDYGIANNTPLLTGTVLEVMLNPPPIGDNNLLDVLFSVTGGALQTINPQDPSVGNFAPSNLAVLRISGMTLPDNWSASFNFSGGRIDVLGTPEPSTLALVALGAICAMGRSRRWFSARSAG